MNFYTKDWFDNLQINVCGGMIAIHQLSKFAKTGAVINMNAKEAAKKIKENNPHMSITECLEFDDFFAFALKEKGKENELMAGGYTTVNKENGAISSFNPVQDFDKFFAATHIDINTLI